MEITLCLQHVQGIDRIWNTAGWNSVSATEKVYVFNRERWDFSGEKVTVLWPDKNVIICSSQDTCNVTQGDKV